MSTGSSTPSLAGAGAASAPNANDVALAKPTDSSMTAVSAQLLLVGPDAWPFDDDRQAQLITALKGDLMWSTGRFPDPLKYVVTDVRSSSAGSAPPGRKLLQVRDRAVLKASRAKCYSVFVTGLCARSCPSSCACKQHGLGVGCSCMLRAVLASCQSACVRRTSGTDRCMRGF